MAGARTKTYLVQTWNEQGGLTNNYEVELVGTQDLKELKKFLLEKCAFAAVVPAAKGAPAPAPRKRRR